MNNTYKFKPAHRVWIPKAGNIEADNLYNLRSLMWYVRHSCALTLASKFKLRTAAQVYKKFGKSLADPETEVNLFWPGKVGNTQRMFNEGKDLNSLQSYVDRVWTAKLSRSVLREECCGNTNVQAHHVRKIRELKGLVLLYNANGGNQS